MARPALTIQLPEQVLTDAILKVLRLPNGVGFLLGTEASDNAFWTQVTGEAVKLTGTFKPDAFGRICKAKKNDTLEIAQADFEWVNSLVKLGDTVQVVCTTAGAMKLDLSKPILAEA
jgi:hypothetical protein